MIARPNKALLDPWDGFRTGLDGEIPSRDHDSVGDLKDFLQAIDSLRAFNFRDQWNVGTLRRDEVSGLLHILGPSNEGQRDIIHSVRDAERQVIAVLFSQGCSRDGDPGKLHALVRSDHSG